MTTSGPKPLVISNRRWWTSSVLVLMVYDAPICLASASFSSSMSAATTVAPRMAERTTAPMPTIPQPMTSTTSMSVTWARLTAWKPTDIGSTSAQVFVVSSPAGMTFSHGSTIYSFIAPWRCTPSVSLCWQALTRWLRHEAHLPQFVYGLHVTTMPGFSPSGTPSPTASMVAPTSWPGMTGFNAIVLRPMKVLMSEPQKPT